MYSNFCDVVKHETDQLISIGKDYNLPALMEEFHEFVDLERSPSCRKDDDLKILKNYFNMIEF